MTNMLLEVTGSLIMKENESSINDRNKGIGHTILVNMGILAIIVFITIDFCQEHGWWLNAAFIVVMLLLALIILFFYTSLYS